MEQSRITFAHLADLHLGAYRENILTQLNFETFEKAITKVIDAKVDFCLFSGDIFHTALASLDLVDLVVKQLLRLKSASIPLYVIGGSHDYTHVGKSYLQLFHTLGLFEDLSMYTTVDDHTIKAKSIIDPKTKTFISGVLGRANGLDKVLYEKLDPQSIQAPFKIFMFHSGLEDAKPEFMKSVTLGVSVSDLPSGFDYYAGGHIHHHAIIKKDTKIIAYPGCLFPNNFSELKREKCSFIFGAFDTNTKQLTLTREILHTFEKCHVQLIASKQTPVELHNQLLNLIESATIKDSIVLLEIKGIVSGKISEIGIDTILKLCYEKGALHVLKNIHQLSTTSVETLEIDTQLSQDSVEEQFLTQYLGKDVEIATIKQLLSLQFSKQEGEKVYQYEERIKELMKTQFNIQKD